MANSAEDKKKIIVQLWELIEPVIQAEGMELIEIAYQAESVGLVLRLYIDRPEGITVDDCARTNRTIGDLLDVADPIPHAYHLEVSSPGLSRPLRKLQHFQAQLGKIIEVRILVPLQGRRNFKGVLLAADNDQITIDCDGVSYDIDLANIDKARLRYFDSMAE